jgi:hypothetical protein
MSAAPRVHALACALVAALCGLLAACAETPPPRSPAPVHVLVLVDACGPGETSEAFAAALGPGAVAGRTGAVSTSAASALATVSIGCEPDRHGRFSARDHGARLPGPALAERLAPRLPVRVAASVPRALAPELVGLDGGFERFESVPRGVLGAALAALAPALAAARADGRGVFALAIEEAPSLAAPRVHPPGLADDLARVLATFADERADAPPFDDLEAWYARTWLADPVSGPLLERAFAAAHLRAFGADLAALVADLARTQADWSVTVVGLAPAAAAHAATGGVALPLELPFATVGGPHGLEPVGELADLASAVLRRCGLDAPPPRPLPTEAGLWLPGGALLGARAGRVAASGAWAGRLAEPPVLALEFELAAGAAPVAIALAADAHCIVGEADGAALARLDFVLAGGERRRVALDDGAPALLLEFARDGAPLPESAVLVGGLPLARVPLPRVLDLRPAELGTALVDWDALAPDERARWLRIASGERGRVVLGGAALAHAAPVVLTWPPRAEPLALHASTDGHGVPTFAFDAPSATRLALLAPDPLAPPRSPVAWAHSGPFAPSTRVCVDGRALAPTALRLAWPPLALADTASSHAPGSAASEAAASGAELAILLHGPLRARSELPANLRARVKALRPWE